MTDDPTDLEDIERIVAEHASRIEDLTAEDMHLIFHSDGLISGSMLTYPEGEPICLVRKVMIEADRDKEVVQGQIWFCTLDKPVDAFFQCCEPPEWNPDA